MATPMTTFRFDDETLDLIERLKDRLAPLALGRELTRADVVRHALATLATIVMPDEQPSTGRNKKKKTRNQA